MAPRVYTFDHVRARRRRRYNPGNPMEKRAWVRRLQRRHCFPHVTGLSDDGVARGLTMVAIYGPPLQTPGPESD